MTGCRTTCDCDDGNFCTVDTCNATTKKCTYTFNFACEWGVERGWVLTAQCQCRFVCAHVCSETEERSEGASAEA